MDVGGDRNHGDRKFPKDRVAPLLKASMVCK